MIPSLFPEPPVMGFDDFWKLCPKKADKDLARRTFERIIRLRRATLVELCEGMASYAELRHGQDQTYTKNPASWLNAGSWKNERMQNGASLGEKRRDPIIAGMGRIADRVAQRLQDERMAKNPPGGDGSVRR